MYQFNRIISEIEPSRSVTLMAKAKEMQKEDPSVINLSGGEPDFATPERICREVTKALKEGDTHYSDFRGNADLRARIADKLLADNGIVCTADDILITPGGKYAVYLTVRALINPGDEAIWLTPGWVSYPSIVQASGGMPVAVHLDHEEEYRVHREQLEAAVSDRTKLLILNSPNNPTGKVFSKEDLKEIKDFLMAHPDVYVLSDEIYESIVYESYTAESLAADPALSERVIVINGFSKSSAMTGWRIGYLMCKNQAMPVIQKLFQHTLSCVSGFLQRGALVALDCKEETQKMREAYSRRRELLLKELGDVPGMKLFTPEGAFYAWIRFDVKEDSAAFAERLLDEAKIAGVPGDAYGEEGGTFVRFSFAASDEVLLEMAKRLRCFMEAQ
ncbi:MAG: pyridoxal phosphate-dependent aminotransferase [Lachnospiraceae bacterium]|nr:pyridoxal phosphate-dependent aminotransferase [Lachnospiraceae bacterium]